MKNNYKLQTDIKEILKYRKDLILDLGINAENFIKNIKIDKDIIKEYENKIFNRHMLYYDNYIELLKRYIFKNNFDQVSFEILDKYAEFIFSCNSNNGENFIYDFLNVPDKITLRHIDYIEYRFKKQLDAEFLTKEIIIEIFINVLISKIRNFKIKYHKKDNIELVEDSVFEYIFDEVMDIDVYLYKFINTFSKNEKIKACFIPSSVINNNKYRNYILDILKYKKICNKKQLLIKYLF